MSYRLLFLAFSLCLTACAFAAFYVAPNGNDRWSGQFPAPNAQQSDGPFATISRAQQAMRLALQAPIRTTPPIVYIRKGTYYLSQPLVFQPEDSGTATTPVIYSAYPGERPIISGGVRLTGWRVSGNRWTLRIPEVAQGNWNFIQLFVNGERRYRPRLPEQGYYSIAGEAESTPSSAGLGSDRFYFTPGDIKARWSNRSDIEALCFQNWSMARLPIAEVDEQKYLVTFTGHTCYDASWARLLKGNRYLIENVKEALNEPGEWYLDRSNGELTYLAKKGETPANTIVIAPKIPQLLGFEGNREKRQWVHHLTFRGLTFAYTNWITPSAGYNCAQAEVAILATVSAYAARDCALEQCRIGHTGNYAVEWGYGCKRNRVDDCEMIDLGAGGVKIGTTGIPDAEALASDNIVRNCLIAHAGRLHPAGIGIWIGQSPNNRIEHNTICDLYYSGISVGWTWGYGDSAAQHNTITANHIYDIGQGVLSDMGGIYTLGVSPGTTVQQNRIHDVDATTYGGWGIYFDEGTTGVLAEDNVVYRTEDAGFHQHYGRENRVSNNVFAFGRETSVRRTREEGHTSFTFEHNIVYSENGILLGGLWTDNHYLFQSNLYWSPRSPLFDGKSLSAWQATGQDTHSSIADPRFVNVEYDDFGLLPTSQALKLGIHSIDVKRVGRWPATPVPIVQRAYPATK